MSIHYPVKLIHFNRANDPIAGNGSRHALIDNDGNELPGFSDLANPTLGHMTADAINAAYNAGVRAAERRIADALGLNGEA